MFVLSERLTFRDVQSPQEFRHGETAEVVCDVISSPVPVVVWYYQDKEITEEHHSKFSCTFTMNYFSSLTYFSFFRVLNESRELENISELKEITVT